MDIDSFNDSVPILDYFKHRHSTPEWFISNKRTTYIDLTYITSGQAVYTINRQKYLAEEGDLLCIPAGSERSAGSSTPSDFECYAANFCLRTMNGQDSVVPLPILSSVGLHPEIISLYSKLNDEYVARVLGFEMRVRALFMLIIQRFMEMLVYNVDIYQYDPRVKSAIRYITENYADPLSIASVAAKVSLNPVYFGTLFKKETKTSFRDYLNTIRINQAEDMLRAGKWNVTEAAQNCGFTDVFYFSRLFKKHKGIPPSAVK